MEYGRISDFYLPPAFLHFHDGPSITVHNMWRIVCGGRSNLAIEPKGLQPKPSSEACYSCWQGEEVMNMDLAAANECRLYADSMSVEAEDPKKMIAGGKYMLSQRSCTAFVHTKISHVRASSDVGAKSLGKLEGDARQGSEQTPIISGGMNALRLPAFFENLGHSNVILTADGGSFGHMDGPKMGAIACRQAEEAWKLWKAGQFGDISLSDGVIEYAKTHEEILFFLLFPGIYCISKSYDYLYL